MVSALHWWPVVFSTMPTALVIPGRNREGGRLHPVESLQDDKRSPWAPPAFSLPQSRTPRAMKEAHKALYQRSRASQKSKITQS